MAKKPDSKPQAKSAKPVSASSTSNGSDRERIIAAFLDLLTEQPYEKIDFAAISARAGVPLDRCRTEFSSPLPCSRRT
jgi:AcrR family transcriptional regulator